MSSFAPTSAVLLALSLAGCMRIYPDAELPDVVVEWEAFTCVDGIGDVRIELRDDVSDELRFEATAPCTDLRLTIADVEREPYRVRGYTLDRSGEVYSVSWSVADLRNGLNKRIDMYWSGYANLVLAWTFADGASCASLGADAILIEMRLDGAPGYQFSTIALCSDPSAWITAPVGPLQVRLRALGALGSVALSEPTPVLDIAEMARTDAGTLTLVPCAGPCPP